MVFQVDQLVVGSKGSLWMMISSFRHFPSILGPGGEVGGVLNLALPVPPDMETNTWLSGVTVNRVLSGPVALAGHAPRSQRTFRKRSAVKALSFHL